MSTKKEMEDQIKLLKDEIRSLRGEVKTTTAEVSGLEDEAYSVDKIGKEYYLVKVVYNVEKGQAAIESSTNIGTSLMNASYKVKTAVIDSLVELNKRR